MPWNNIDLVKLLILELIVIFKIKTAREVQIKPIKS